MEQFSHCHGSHDDVFRVTDARVTFEEEDAQESEEDPFGHMREDLTRMETSASTSGSNAKGVAVASTVASACNLKGCAIDGVYLSVVPWLLVVYANIAAHFVICALIINF